MRLIHSPDGTIDRFDRAVFVTRRFDVAWGYLARPLVPPERLLRVGHESRVLRVAAEDRVLRVAHESRSLKV